MKHDRPSALKRIILSPGVSVLAGIAGALLMMLSAEFAWAGLALSAAISAVMVYEMKARMLFRGHYYPFAGLFMLAQAAAMPDLTGMAMLAAGATGLIVLMHCFNRPDFTRSIFLVFLLCGLGATAHRCFALLAALMLLCVILVRAFSLRGLVAALLGLVTPAILLLPFRPDHGLSLLADYSRYFVPGYSAELIAVGAVALLSAMAVFLPSYGYPAKTRARNMSILGLAIGSIALPFLDFEHWRNYLGLMNLCCAYNLCHLASLKQRGWIYVVIGWAVFVAITIYGL